MFKLLVGLGNPSAEYQRTRHNAGFWFLDALVKAYGGTFRQEKKFLSEFCEINFKNQPLKLLKPQTFMNRSGAAVSLATKFYKIKPEEILVIHDELDFQPSQIKAKLGGGSAGHNGLKDIISALGTNNFYRLRIGIGRPKNEEVINFVLKEPSKADFLLIEEAINKGIKFLENVSLNGVEKAINELHRN